MIRVVAASIQNQHGEYLLTRRPSGKVRAGEWEFPGGKMHRGESTHQALVRELREELGLKVLASEPLHSFSHHYPDLNIELNLLRVLRWQHEPQALEQQQLRWVGIEAMRSATLSAADVRIAGVLQLPPLLFITPNMAALDAAQALPAMVRKATMLGAALVYFRQPQLAPAKLVPLLEQILHDCHQRAVGVLCNREYLGLTAAPIDGLHLRARELSAAAQDSKLQQWRSQHPQALLGASCHNAAELELAARLACSHVLLSPVKPTATHPQAKALGWRGLQQLSANCDVPLYALGGLEPADLDQAREHGAYGVAGISGFCP